MDDIVTRLRQWSLVTFTRPALHNLPSELTEAADEIERLRTENAAMRRQALQNMINESENAGLYQQP